MLESKTARVWFCASLVLCATSCGGALNAQEKHSSVPFETRGADYRIGPRDTVQIEVWEEPDISRTVQVRPDGKIYLPLLNDVQAAGLTAMQLAGVIRKGLTDYLTNPQVTVIIRGIAGGTKFLITPSMLHPLIVSPPPLSPDLKPKCCAA